MPPTGFHGKKKKLYICYFTVDDGIPATNFYGKLNKLAKIVTLRDADAAISVLPDSDVEDDDELVDGDENIGLGTQEDDGKEDTDEEDNIQLSVLAERLRQNEEKSAKKKNIVWQANQFSPPQIVYIPKNYQDENAPNNPSPRRHLFFKILPKRNFQDHS